MQNFKIPLVYLVGYQRTDWILLYRLWWTFTSCHPSEIHAQKGSGVSCRHCTGYRWMWQYANISHNISSNSYTFYSVWVCQQLQGFPPANVYSTLCNGKSFKSFSFEGKNTQPYGLSNIAHCRKLLWRIKVGFHMCTQSTTHLWDYVLLFPIGL